MEPITALITTSPIPSHPSTAIIDETIASIRHHIPDAAIVILCDGVRPELEHRRADYQLFLEQLHKNAANIGKTTTIVTFPEHLHQSGMLRKYVPYVNTELILFCEHDLPLRTDVEIDFEGISQAVLSTEVDHVRFMLMPHIHEEHNFLMLGRMQTFGVPLMKTRQFSCWSHVTSKNFYTRVLRQISPRAKCFIEPFIQGLVDNAQWEEYRLTIYLPDDKDSRRIYHTNGRSTDPKFEHLDVYQ